MLRFLKTGIVKVNLEASRELGNGYLEEERKENQD
jgi:hypothetical protein